MLLGDSCRKNDLRCLVCRCWYVNQLDCIVLALVMGCGG